MSQSSALICIGLLALGSIFAAPRGSQPRQAAEPTPWIALDNHGGWFGERLTVSADGRAQVFCDVQFRSRYIGSFEMKLSPRRLAALREAIARAHVEEMKDDYPASSEDADYGLVDLTVVMPRGRKTVRATEISADYPPKLRELFDLNAQLPGPRDRPVRPAGLLSQLTSEVAQHPKAAIGVEASTPKRTYRVGEPIPVTVRIRNVGTQTVVIPSPECQLFAQGAFWAWLVPEDPLASEELPETSVEFGASSPGDGRLELPESARPDLAHAIRLTPGRSWQIALPLTLGARRAGRYALRGQYTARESYSGVGKCFADALILGSAAAEDIPLTVVAD